MNNKNDSNEVGVALPRLVRKFPIQPFVADEITVRLYSALQRAGFDATLEDIEWAWKQHSDDRAASFLGCQDDAEADYSVRHLLKYLVPANDKDLARRALDSE